MKVLLEMYFKKKLSKVDSFYQEGEPNSTSVLTT